MIPFKAGMPMWACLLLCLLHLTSSSPIVTEKQDSAVIEPRRDVSRNDTRLPLVTKDWLPVAFIQKSCTAEQKHKIARSWRGAVRLGKAMTGKKAGYNYDIPHEQWFGKDWNQKKSLIPPRKDYRRLLGDNFKRIAKMFSMDAPKHDYIYIYCTDPAMLCEPTHVGHAWSSTGTFWSNHYLVTCNFWFDAPTLDQQIERYGHEPYEQKVMENFHLTRDVTIFHLAMKFKRLATYPVASEITSHALRDWNLAKKYGAEATRLNADSYAMDATAIYVQQQYKNNMSPIPYMELQKIEPEAANSTSKRSSVKAKYVDYDGPPSGWEAWAVPPPQNDTEQPDIDMDEWEPLFSNKRKPLSPAEREPPPVDEPELSCIGLDNKKWVAEETFTDALADFCEDAEKQGGLDENSGAISRHYNDKKSDHVKVMMEWQPGLGFKPNKEDCIKYLDQIKTKCDKKYEKANPLNWKHGGTVRVGNITYSLAPQTERYKPGRCSMHVRQTDDFSGIDGPGTARKHKYFVKIDAMDANGEIFTSTDGNKEAGAENMYEFEAYHATMEVTPQAHNDYIHFTMSGQSWKSSQSTGAQRCQVGGWNRGVSPRHRDMDCFFDC